MESSDPKKKQRPNQKEKPGTKDPAKDVRQISDDTFSDKLIDVSLDSAGQTQREKTRSSERPLRRSSEIV